MAHTTEELLHDILVDSEFAKTLVPNKFKHTSKQGRARRKKLLTSAKKLSGTHDITDISLADICKDAGIPRASAYHFFPNVESLFLALRFINYIETLESVKELRIADFLRWQDYVAELIEKAVELLNSDPTKLKLMYGAHSLDFEGSEFEERVDVNVIEMIVSNVSSYYDVSKYDKVGSKLLIAYTLAHSVFSLSYRRYGYINNTMKEEAIKASISYLRCYLPEHLVRLDQQQ